MLLPLLSLALLVAPAADADEVIKESKEETNIGNNNHLNSNVVCATEQEERDTFE